MSAPGVDRYELTTAAIAEGDRIEASALPGEDGFVMRAELNHWFTFYRTTSPIAIWMIARAFHDSVRLRRVRRAAAATRQSAINRAQDKWDDAEDDKVRKQRQNITFAPADAVRELEGFAAGCRWLINRWQRLKGQLAKDGTLYGGDRDEAIRLQGAIPALERLRESEAALLTWGCCLLAQPEPDQDEIAALAATGATSLSLRGVEPSKTSQPPLKCREWLFARIERELTRLRQREEQLWVEQEEPARTARIQQALLTVEANLRTLARYEKTAEQSLKRNLAAVARECKRTGIVVPRGLPYKTL